MKKSIYYILIALFFVIFLEKKAILTPVFAEQQTEALAKNTYNRSEVITKFVYPGRWDGWYGGLHYAYPISKFSINSVKEILKGAPLTGIFLGYNTQKGIFVYGFDADVTYEKAKTSLITLPYDNHLEFGMRERFGLAIGDLYAYLAPGLFLDNIYVPNDNLSFGGSLGIGFDLLVFPHIMIRSEMRYNYHGFGFIDKSIHKLPSKTASLFRFGLGYKF